MSEKIAKKLRKKVYGKKSYRERTYKRIGGTIEADEIRQIYQKLKKEKIKK